MWEQDGSMIVPVGDFFNHTNVLSKIDRVDISPEEILK